MTTKTGVQYQRFSEDQNLNRIKNFDLRLKKLEQEKRIKDFTDLEVWKNAHTLVLSVYKLTSKLPKSETFGLISQMQRASVSITSNIAEGFGRQSFKEKIQFYYLAHGSLTELKNQLIICRDLSYISNSDFDKIQNNLITSQKILQGLIRKSKTFLNPKS